MDNASEGFVRVGALDDLRARRRTVVSTPGGAVLLVADGDEVVALDNPSKYFVMHNVLSSLQNHYIGT